jgi:tRNA (cmo5U34)-methyltransferase
MEEKKDTIYAGHMDKVSGFVFDNTVADVFPDMIRRSVPGYETIVNMTGIMTAKFARPGTYCYDLGCSLGASTLSVCRRADMKEFSVVAVDNSPAMISRAKKNLRRHGFAENVHFICEDINRICIQNASAVIMNFTLQFINPSQRSDLVNRICAGMIPGGIMILSEKIEFSDSELQSLHTELHHTFKRLHGYSDLEISRKRAALEDVLVTETVQTHLKRLRTAGFSSCEVWFQCLNFASIIAIKDARPIKTAGSG